MLKVLAIALTNQHPALVDPAVGAVLAAVDTFAGKLEQLLFLFDLNRGDTGHFRPDFRIGQVFDRQLELSHVRNELARFTAL